MATHSLTPIGVSDGNVADHKSCTKSKRLNSAGKLRQNMTEAEKEARRFRQILANRESARRSIRRRQAMYQELTRKVVDLSEENENLKKEKDLAVVEYNSVKGKNKILKQQMANAKKGEPREAEPISSTRPVFLYHPCLVPPLLWPYSNLIHLPYMSYSDVRCWDTSSSDVGIAATGQGNPSFVLPLPLALPYPIYGTHSATPSDNNSSGNCMVMPENVLSCIRPPEENISAAATEAVICSPEQGEKYESTAARRRRKEVMILKNV